MTIHLNEGESIEVVFGDQSMTITAESRETSRMEFNNIEYQLHEGNIFADHLNSAL